MKQINGNAKNPTFTLQSGEVLKLKPVTDIVLGLWAQRYESENPAPKPPIITLANGDTEPDESNKVYLAEHGDYTNKMNTDLAHFVIQYGVLNDCPKGFVSSFGFLGQPKVLWIMEQLADSEELGALIEAITSLSNATEKAIEDAEKN